MSKFWPAIIINMNRILIFVTIFCGTAYGYYFYHDVLARLVVELGWLAVPVLALVILLVALVVSGLTGLPLFRKRKLVPSAVAGEVRPPLDIKMLLLGVGVGLLIMVPMIVTFVWLSRNVL